MKIKARPCKGKDLKPGDLFSTYGPEYWENVAMNRSCGERVYIRMETPYYNFDDAEMVVFRITIEKDQNAN